jgi:preprotein translocase subunit SecA
MNSQREVVYNRRKNALFGQKLDIEISNMVYDLLEIIVERNFEYLDFENFKYDLLKTFAIEPPFDEATFKKYDNRKLVDDLHKFALEKFKERMRSIRDQLLPFIEQTYNEQSGQTEFVSVLIADGMKIFKIMSELKASYDTKGYEIIKDLEKIVMLVAIDEQWKEHLREMDALKQAVSSASYEQKDPLLIYKMEAFDLFKDMLERTNTDIISSLFRSHIYIPEEAPKRGRRQRQVKSSSAFDFKKLQLGRSDTSGQSGSGQTGQRKRTTKKVGRNDPCPCGSGKKYKNCCGRNA